MLLALPLKQKHGRNDHGPQLEASHPTSIGDNIQQLRDRNPHARTSRSNKTMLSDEDAQLS